MRGLALQRFDAGFLEQDADEAAAGRADFARPLVRLKRTGLRYLAALLEAKGFLDEAPAHFLDDADGDGELEGGAPARGRPHPPPAHRGQR
jgi:hypothetical protein